MPKVPFVDWRDSTPKLWARFTSVKFRDGVYHAFYSLLDEPMPENRGIIPQSVCGLVYEEHVVPEKEDFWPEVGVACRRCVNSVTKQNRRALDAKVRAAEDGSSADASSTPAHGSGGPPTA